MDSLNTGILKALPLLVPPRSEQHQLLAHISNATLEIDLAVSSAQRQIDLLREYRTRLIADVVTGKVDVRAVAAALPEVEPEVEDDEPLDEDDEMMESEDGDDDEALDEVADLDAQGEIG